MALPTSGNISLSQLIAEFGGGTKLTDFYRGGAWVPNTAANANVPTSGQISMTQFYGASKTTVNVALNYHYVSDFAAEGSPTNPTATYSLLSNGTVTTSTATSGSTTHSGEWLVSGTASNYECLVTNSGGAALGAGSSALGSWLALSTSRGWNITVSLNTSKTTTLTVSIRQVGTTTVLATTTIDLEVSKGSAI
jgi:hypothetical protein